MAANSDPKRTDLASLFTPAEVLCGLDQLDEDEILRRLIERIAGAPGMLEKRYQIRVVFLEWFGVGLTSAAVAVLVAYGALPVQPFPGAGGYSHPRVWPLLGAPASCRPRREASCWK